jgi:thioredoxin-like negative regulator of GroEL
MPSVSLSIFLAVLQLATSNVVVLNSRNMEAKMQAGRMFVHFTVDGSRECQQIYNPMIKKLAERFPGKIAKVYCDRDEDICHQMGLQGVPSFMLVDPHLQPWHYQMNSPNVDDVAKFLQAAFGIEDPDKEDLYAIMEVERDAPQAVIRKAYRSLSLKYHPDKHSGNEDMKSMFEAIGRAYEIIGDADKRKVHDSQGGLEFHSSHDVQMAKMYGMAVDTANFYSEGDIVTNFRYQNFFSEIGSGVWMVEFYAPWCKPCQELVPQFKGAAVQLEGKAKFGAVNCDDEEQLCQRMNIHSYPTVKFFMIKKGTSSNRHHGDSILAATFFCTLRPFTHCVRFCAAVRAAVYAAVSALCA